MSSPFSRSLRSLEAERSRGWLPALVAAALLVAWLAWFLLARVPLYETTPLARIEAAAAAHRVDARMAGRAVRVHLSLGARVRAGDVLVELESEAERLRLDEAKARLAALAPEIDAVRREIVAEERAIADERGAGAAALDEQRAMWREAQAALRLAGEDATRLTRLRADGLVTELDEAKARAEQDKRRAAADAAGTALARLARDLQTRESDRRVRVQRLRGALARLGGEVSTAGAAVRRLDHDVERRLVRAPIDGRIAEAAELRAGAVVDEGDRLASIVPDGTLRVVAQFPPAAAIGRVRPGQAARVRLLGFPWTEYGSLAASVTRVADDVRDGLVRVELAVVGPAPFPVQHALPGSVEVEVERVRPASLVLRTLGGFLTRPVKTVASPAGGG